LIDAVCALTIPGSIATPNINSNIRAALNTLRAFTILSPPIRESFPAGVSAPDNR
jgi:hypothetical protein